jgi:hypothetical protein
VFVIKAFDDFVPIKIRVLGRRREKVSVSNHTPIGTSGESPFFCPCVYLFFQDRYKDFHIPIRPACRAIADTSHVHIRSSHASETSSDVLFGDFVVEFGEYIFDRLSGSAAIVSSFEYEFAESAIIRLGVVAAIVVVVVVVVVVSIQCIILLT